MARRNTFADVAKAMPTLEGRFVAAMKQELRQRTLPYLNNRLVQNMQHQNETFTTRTTGLAYLADDEGGERFDAAYRTATALLADASGEAERNRVPGQGNLTVVLTVPTDYVVFLEERDSFIQTTAAQANRLLLRAIRQAVKDAK